MVVIQESGKVKIPNVYHLALLLVGFDATLLAQSLKPPVYEYRWETVEQNLQVPCYTMGEKRMLQMSFWKSIPVGARAIAVILQIGIK